MVDRALFTDMSGAKQAMAGLRIIANNLANANTTGFKADFTAAKTHAHPELKMDTRVASALHQTYANFQQGPLINTERPLDIAMNGSGFIAVQSPDGSEGYTRAGNLEVSANGLLMTAQGHIVLGDTGVITIPPYTQLSIDEKGIITVQLPGQAAKELSQVGRIRLVDPKVEALEKGTDGLFRVKDGGTAPISDKARIFMGYLEGSNVQPIKAMTELIDISRQFEIHTKLMKTVEDNSAKANQLLGMES